MKRIFKEVAYLIFGTLAMPIAVLMMLYTVTRFLGISIVEGGIAGWSLAKMKHNR